MVFLKKIANYLQWANDTIWEIVETLSDEEFSRTFYDSGGSIHSRYIHLAEDTWEWYHDWHGESPEEPDLQSMTRTELYDFIKSYTTKWIRLIDERTINELDNERAGTVLTLKFDEMFFHMVNHFTYHRGQIVMSLKFLGKEVPMTDYVPHRFSIL
ncbi:MAG: DinB family protein [Candidatus Thorarchaeota archaeon]